MRQQIQEGRIQPAQTKSGAQQPIGKQTQPVKKKKLSGLMWLIIVLVIGAGIYFLGRYFGLF